MVRGANGQQTFEVFETSKVLSVSVVRVSELIGARRVDAEAYRPEMLNAYIAIEHLPYVQLDTRIAFVTDGQHGYHQIDEESEIKHLTAQCIRNGYVDATNADRISAEMHARNQRSACKVGDVLLSTAGTIGNAGVVTADILPANMDQDIARIKIHDQHKLNPWYVATFLNSKFGQFQTERESTGQVQQRLALEKVRQLRIPLLDGRDAIARKAQKSFELFHESERLYTQAQALLAAELGLGKLDLSESLYSVRRVSEVQKDGRMDAEYYREKYYRVMNFINQCEKHEALGKLIEPIRNGFDYREFVEEGTPYIRVGDVQNGRIDLESSVKIPIVSGTQETGVIIAEHSV